MAADAPNAAQDPGFFDGRFMVEIETWDWALYVGLSPPGFPTKYSFQGGMNYSRWIDITGRVRGPSRHRGKSFRVCVSPIGRKITFGKKGLQEVGQFYAGRPDGPKTDFEATLLLPEEGLGPAVTCLSSIWKFLHIWVVQDVAEASVMAFSFSADIPPNLTEFAGPALEARDSKHPDG